MKVISYNVNGLNAFIKNGKFDALLSDYPADIYCFQEVKADEEKVNRLLTQYPQFTAYHAINLKKKGYSGVSTLIKNELISKIRQYNVVEFDIDSEYLGGRILTVEFDTFYLVNVYVLNSGNKDDLRKLFDRSFVEYIRDLNLQKPTVIVGDMNVCATEMDYWGDYKKSINSMPGLKDFEISGMQTLLTENNLVDTYRKQHPNDRKYSWYSPMNRKSLETNSGWRIDYVLVTDSFADNVISDICEKYQAPDHSPLNIEICI